MNVKLSGVRLLLRHDNAAGDHLVAIGEVVLRISEIGIDSNYSTDFDMSISCNGSIRELDSGLKETMR